MPLVNLEKTDDFQPEVVEAELPVLVDFSADWCAPCVVLGPVLEELSENEFAGTVKIVRVDVDKCPELARKFGVSGIPTMVVMKGGEVVGTKVGLLPREALVEWINSVK